MHQELTNTSRRLNTTCETEWDAAAARLQLPPLSIKAQPQPAPSSYPASWSLVISDMAQRNRFGVGRYGVPLQPGNGRDALMDAYEEALDLVVYLRTAIYERDNGVSQKKV